MPPEDPNLSVTEMIVADVTDPILTRMSSLQRTSSDPFLGSPTKTVYTRQQLLYYAKCFESEHSVVGSVAKPGFIRKLLSLPSVLIRYGVLLPLRTVALGMVSTAFFTTLPIALLLKSKSMVSKLVFFYNRGILFSLGVIARNHGRKDRLKEAHVFVANHTSYLDYILVSAYKYPNAVVMARSDGGAFAFLQRYGLSHINSLCFDRHNFQERKLLAERLKAHVMNPTTWPNPMIIFPEGTCVNNQHIIRFQKGAFELGVKVCPVAIKYDRAWGDPYWDTRKGFLYYAFYRMTRWATPVDVYYCTPEERRPGEDAVQFGTRVKSIISERIGLIEEDFNGMAKRDLLKVLDENAKDR
ncbi:uncharacterized protein BYT42DRAFT_607804 [Radiomyces spectabilis]|uniref:uncharacterized protein n=1 Tax=Radiomyces spectabilis TaxID=64574 RepID=UPI00221F06BD|nr:uncharacterized protein BYT42DRAFT_607804 [Radiomyces spectabilis]KAI8369378.1 hypothetical protein BYT42DRAFT_607804 [Radiomyces spectabilis]